MERTGYIFNNICDAENIKTAVLRSSLGKRGQNRVNEILENIDVFIEIIQSILVDKSYVPSPYKIKIIQDGATKKVRKIYKPNYFPDQIIHWALVLASISCR